MTLQQTQTILNKFGIPGRISEILPIKTGHINETNLVVTDDGKKYTLQCINTNVFTKPYEVMENILRVTDYLRANCESDDPRKVLHFYSGADGKGIVLGEDGRCWRVYDYIDDALTYDIADDLQILTDAGAAFGTFQKQLSDFPGSSLNVTIPDFHHTPKRFANLMKGIDEDVVGRAASIPEEIAFFKERLPLISRLQDGADNGTLPLRVTHNDTKFNNILIDKATHKPLAVIDLDTIMPGLAAFDFGDAIRFCTNTAAEDEPDLDKVHFSLDKFEAFAKGFIGNADGFFTEAEIDSMAWGAVIITLEIGSRFLLDYLQGDVYFHTEYPEHNLVRAHTQMRLAKEMEENFDRMQAIVRKYV